MKKYLMTGVAALAICAAFTSCSKSEELYDQGVVDGQKVESINEQYAAAFEKAFGKVGPNVDWGFGSGTRAFTRASDFLKSKFTLPTFRSKSAITKPDTPTFYTTLNQVKAAGIAYVGDIDYNNGWDNVTAAYLDENSNAIRSDRSQGRTYYISGDVKYGDGFSSGDVTLVVLENSTLHLGCASSNLRIYLASGATLDVTKEIYKDWTDGGKVKEKDWEGQWTFEKSNALLYLSEGSNVIGGNFKFFDGAKILNNGGTITAANADVDKNTTLWNEGTVNVSNKLQGVNENAFIYNAVGKTISAASLELINNSDLLVNDGTVTITNGIALQNSGAEIVNNADMSCGSFSQAAGAKMYNVGNMTMTGLTHLDNSNSGWVNDGQWTCGSFEVLGNDKGAGNNFNNCRLTVNGEFYLNREAFILDSDAGVVCESFKIDDTSGFYLGNKSVLKINGTLTTEIVNPEYGFFAYGSEYAVVQANGIETTTNDPESINYYGNLLVAINPHISQYTAQSSVKFTKDGQNIATIPSSTCSPGYEGTTPPSTPTYRVIAEDLSVGGEETDFDFNDVVFDVEPNAAGDAADIIVVAAGGIYQLKVADVEVHEALGCTADADGLYPMINTGDGPTKDPQKIATISGDFSNDEAIRQTIKNISIYVWKPQGGDKTNIVKCPIEATTGRPAGKILVDKNFPVVPEHHSIANEHSNFRPYVRGSFDGDVWW